MTALSSMDDYITRAGDGYIVTRNFSVEVGATTSTLYTGQLLAWQLSPIIYKVETMPTGVTAFKLTNATLYNSNVTSAFLVKLVNLGNFNIGTQVYTDGSTMPTVTEGAVSRRVYGGILMAVTTAFDAVAASFTITYRDQDNNIAPVSPAMAKTVSAVVGTAGFATLNTGDYGATDISGAARTSGTGAGVVTFYGVVPLGTFGPLMQNSATAMQVNNLTATPCPPILDANDEIYILQPGTAGKRYFGTLTFIGDQA